MILIPVAILAAAAFLAKPGPTAAKPPPKIPLVSVTQARRQDLPLTLGAQGHLVALNIVEVRPQLSATIVAIHFKEGDEVKAGQLLFSLDSADAATALQRAQALAAQIQAQLADARRDYERASALVKSSFIAASAVDTAAGKVDALQAQLKAAQADVDSARLALGHARILAPFSGTTGAVAVHPGSLAQAGATAPLVTLAQFSPIGVEFNLPQQALPAILRARQAGAVAVAIDGPDGKPVAGELTFINNVVNADSGTISLKATLPNPRRLLWPGAYVRVTMQAGMDKDAVVLPPQALLEGPAGRFVYLAGDNGKAIRQAVTLLRIQGELAVVGGLADGTRVVLEGGGNLRDGDAIRIAAGAPHAGADTPVPALPGKAAP
ncbi:MAG: efflux RND transporter periplasmic adaptor subunit [Pseudomonadota bacterium]